MLVIEHNPDVIKCADHVIDLGPEGGDEGGYIVAEGAPEQVAKVAKSYTGQVLKHVLAVAQVPKPAAEHKKAARKPARKPRAKAGVAV